MSSLLQPLIVPSVQVGSLMARRSVVIDNVPNPFINEDGNATSEILYSKDLLFYVMDSPVVISSQDKAVVGVLIVPAKRERDWYFSTEEGRRTLFNRYHNVSRIILAINKLEESVFYDANSVDMVDEMFVELKLGEMLTSLLPKGCTELNFLKFEDQLISVVQVCEITSRYHKKISVDAVQVEGNPVDIRRRLRFLTCPDHIMCDMRFAAEPKPGMTVPDGLELVDMKDMQNTLFQDFVVDTSILIQPDVIAMTASLSISLQHLQEKHDLKIHPKALCLGVGSGMLPSFWCKQLDFAVVGVEIDSDMVFIAKNYLGFEENDNLILIRGDAVEAFREMVNKETKKSLCQILEDQNVMYTKYDVIVLDVSIGIDRYGVGSCSPVPKCLTQQFFNETSMALNKGGLLVVNVVAPDHIFSSKLLRFMKKSYGKIWKIPMASDHQYILIGLQTTVRPDDDDIVSVRASLGPEGIRMLWAEGEKKFSLQEKLKDCIPARYLDDAFVEV